MATLGTNYGKLELQYALAVQDAISYYLVDGSMPNYGTLYGDREKRLAIAIVENTSIGGGGGSISDGNKGDVTVSGGGTNWAVNDLPQSRITDLTTDLSAKQDALVSGTNIKTINGQSVLGSDDLSVTANPAGLNTEIQFNDNGSLGASNNLVWDNVSNQLGIGVVPMSAQIQILSLYTSMPTVSISAPLQQRDTANLLEFYSGDGILKSWVTSYGGLFLQAEEGYIETVFAVKNRIDESNHVSITSKNPLESDVYFSEATTFNVCSKNTFITSCHAEEVPLVVGSLGVTQTANLIETRNSSNAVLSVLSKADGSYKPSFIADTLITNSSLYYSTTLNRLAYKDDSGNVFAQNKRQINNKTTSYTLTIADDYVRFDGVSLTATLPSATTMLGHEFEIKNINLSSLTVNTTSSQVMDGSTLITLNQYEVLRVVSNGTGWDII